MREDITRSLDSLPNTYDVEHGCGRQSNFGL